METDVGELQAAASRKKSQCKAGQGSGWQTKPEAKMLKNIQISLQEQHAKPTQDFQGPANYGGSCGGFLQVVRGQQIWDIRTAPAPEVRISMDRA